MAETYGRRVARLRKEHGWTQAELAEVSGVKKRTLQDIEADAHPTVQRANRIALNRALEMEEDRDVDALFADFRPDVIGQLLVIGAFLETKTPQEALDWFIPIARQVRGTNSS